MPQNLNKRQETILEFFDDSDGGHLSASEVGQKVASIGNDISAITVKRDLKTLVDLRYLEREGKGRSVRYVLSQGYQLIRTVDVPEYFKTPVDERRGKTRFDFSVLSQLTKVFTDEEIARLADLRAEYQSNLGKLPADLRQKELERLVIELSWKSSQIEGNTYSLLETESLIKNKEEAVGHKKEEAVMILNHKKALDYILAQAGQFETISVAKIEDIHSLLIDGLGVARGLRQSPVGITGTLYTPLDNQFQIKEALEMMCRLINEQSEAFSRAFLAMLLISYIQPFDDGNKRTSRLVGNALLLANGICPLSYRSVNEVEYKKAVILFYEKNNLGYFKQIFIDQFEFAVKNYFRTN